MDWDSRMPYGKYKGMPLREVPRSYLKWLADSATSDSPLIEFLRGEYEELRMETKRENKAYFKRKRTMEIYYNNFNNK